MHCEVERRVVVLCGGKVTVDGDFSGKFFADFANKSLFGRLADIDFAAGKLPPVLPLAIATLCGKYPLAIHYDSRYHLDAPPSLNFLDTNIFKILIGAVVEFRQASRVFWKSFRIQTTVAFRYAYYYPLPGTRE